MIARRLTPGAISMSNSSHLTAIPASVKMNPGEIPARAG